MHRDFLSFPGSYTLQIDMRIRPGYKYSRSPAIPAFPISLLSYKRAEMNTQIRKDGRRPETRGERRARRYIGITTGGQGGGGRLVGGNRATSHGRGYDKTCPVSSGPPCCSVAWRAVPCRVASRRVSSRPTETRAPSHSRRQSPFSIINC